MQHLAQSKAPSTDYDSNGILVRAVVAPTIAGRLRELASPRAMSPAALTVS
jgi:hypothetical protein